MKWPLPQDFNEAIQNPAVSFADPDLAGGETVEGPHGLPLPHSGNFADVYQIRGADGQYWAVKCFTRPVFGLNVRYARLAEELDQANFRFTVGFTFLAEGIRVRGEWRPIIKMEWVEGRPLNQVVADHAGNPKVLHALAHRWMKLCRQLREAGMAHGDLQHGNVLLVPGSRPGAYSLKLVDYDGMYVPSLAGTPSGEAGHPNFQHPERLATRAYSRDLDRFPHLVIVTALTALNHLGPDLWSRFDNGDNLLFAERDFRDPARSAVMRELWQSGHAAVQSLVGRLAIACGRPLSATPWVDEVSPDGEPVPLGSLEEAEASALLGSTGPFLPVMPKFEPEPVETSAARASDSPHEIQWEPAEPAQTPPSEPEYEAPEPEYDERDYDQPVESSRKSRPRSRGRIRPRRRRSRAVNLLPGLIVAAVLLVVTLTGVTIFVVNSRGAGTEEANRDSQGPGFAQTTPWPPMSGPMPTPPDGFFPRPSPGGFPSTRPVARPGVPPPTPPTYPASPSDRPELDLRPQWTAGSLGMGEGPLVIDPTAETVFHATSFRSSFSAFNLRTGELRPAFEGLGSAPVVGLFPLDGGRVGIYSRDDTEVRVLNAKTGQSAGTIPVPPVPEGAGGARALTVSVSPNGRYVAAGRNGMAVPVHPLVPIQIVDTSSGRVLLNSTWKGGVVSFTADSSRVLVATFDGQFRWFNLPGGEPGEGWDFRAPVGVGWHFPGGISADGKLIGYSGPGRPVGRVPSERLLRFLDGSGNEVRRFSPRIYDDSLPPVVSADGRFAVVKRSSNGDARLAGTTLLEIVDTITLAPFARVSYRGWNKPVLALAPDARSLVVHDTSMRGLYCFSLTPGGSSAPGVVAGRPGPSAPFRIISRHSAHVLALDNGATGDGTKVVTARYSDDDLAQQWRAVPAGYGWYYLENLKSGTVVTVSGKGKDDGAEIVVSKKEVPPSGSQLWKTSAMTDREGAIDFQCRASGKVLAVDAGSRAAGARILLWSDNPETSKRFTVIPVK